MKRSSRFGASTARRMGLQARVFNGVAPRLVHFKVRPRCLVARAMSATLQGLAMGKLILGVSGPPLSMCCAACDPNRLNVENKNISGN